MEGVAVLSLCCNVIELVKVAREAVKACDEFYKRGTTARIQEMRYNSQQLNGCTSELLNSLRGVPQKASVLPSCVELTDLTQKCCDTAKMLDKELKSLEKPPGSGFRVAIFQFYRANRKASHIEKVKQRLGDHENVLKTKILVHLSQNMGTLGEQQADILNRLDVRHRDLAGKILEGNTRLADLFQLVSEQTKEHITRELRAYGDEMDRKIDILTNFKDQQAKYDDFLQSLHFPKIYLRQDEIENAHRQTFEWVFKDPSQEPSMPWDSFAEWLQNDRELYWILGKPGSGKSTLMNFLVHEERTQTALKRDSDDEPTILATFFFCAEGEELQKNQIGLLRSLIYQLLKSIDPGKAFQIWLHSVSKETNLPISWTTRRLLPILRTVVQSIDRRLCLFLDGLDEFQDGREAITEVLEIFKLRHRIKICISSRESIGLEELWKNNPKLRLHQLTERDIRACVKGWILENSKPKYLDDLGSRGVKNLVDVIVEKAEGVFLWVRLVFASLLVGILIEDDLESLRKRLDECPSGINDLYRHMLRRMQLASSVDAEEATFYLQLFLEVGSLSLLETTIARDESLQSSYIGPAATVDLNNLGEKINCERIRKRLMVCCSGFLEVNRTAGVKLDDVERFQETLKRSVIGQHPETIKRLVGIYKNRTENQVSFIHRTAREFLQTPSGQLLLEGYLLPEEDMIKRQFNVYVVLFLLTPLAAGSMWHMRERIKLLLELNSKNALDMMQQLENVYDKLHSWGVFHEGDFPRLVTTGKPDYAKVLLEFSPVAYVKKWLEKSMMLQDSSYLLDLLRCCLPYLKPNRPEILEIVSFLLKSGADPNSAVSAAVENCSIWQCFLIKFRKPYFHGEDARMKRLALEVRATFLKAGADPNRSLFMLLCHDPNGGFNSLTDPLDGFILLKWNAFRSIQPLSDTNDDANRLQSAGANGSQKWTVLFNPPNSWQVLPVEICFLDCNEQSMFMTFHHYHLFGIHVSEEQLKLMLERNHAQPEFFSNGVDALRAANWTNEDIQHLPLLQKVLDKESLSWREEFAT